MVPILVAIDIDGTLDANPSGYESLMSALHDAGHRIAVLTGASDGKVTKDELARKCQFLTEMGVGCLWDDLVVFASPPHKGKAKWVRKHGAAFLIDNSTKTAKLAEKYTTVLVPWATRSDRGEAQKDARFAVVKASEERRFTLGLAYPANKPDVAVASDGHRDFVSEKALEEAAWSYLRKSGRVGLQHRDGTEGHGTVVESYIWRGPDWHVGNSVVKSGDWVLGIRWDEATWPLIKSGALGGFSPQGTAKRSTPTPEALAKLRKD